MRLTDRQRQVAERVAAGAKRASIAADLQITVKTVDYHLVKIRRKFGVNSMLEIAVCMVGLEVAEKHGIEHKLFP